MSNKEYPIVDNAESFAAALGAVREAQKTFSTFTQEQVDKIFLAASTAACRARIPLAKMAVEETGMGVVEDKVIKNHFASEYIYNAYKDVKTCGVIEENKVFFQCFDLSEVTIPLNITKIADSAFEDCSPELTIKAYTGSYGVSFAKAHNYKLVEMKRK